MRYFQSNRGTLGQADNPVAAASFRKVDGWAEVQVVPLDAIVIRRDELPKVCQGERGLTVEGIGGYFRASAEYTNGITARDYALALLATQEHLREHPPVDEAQVDKVAQVLAAEHADDNGNDWTTFRDTARSLVRAGITVRVEQS